MEAETARIVFVMPRCRHDHVRGVHKQAYSLAQDGHEVVLVVKHDVVKDYLGMQVVAAHSPFDSLLRPLLNLPSLFRQVRRLNADIFVLRNPDTIPLAFVLRVFGYNIIYDTQEDFSKRPLIRESLPVWVRPAVAWLLTACERLLARMSSTVVITQAQQSKTLGGRTLLQPNAPLTTGPILEHARTMNVARSVDDFLLIYAGEISRARGVFAMLELVRKINEIRPCWLELLGWFASDSLKDEVTKYPGWCHVRYRGAVSHAEALARISQADVGLAILDSIADYPTSSITKLYEYMQFGVPVIASNFPAWTVSTPIGPAGIFVDPTSMDEIFAAGRKLAADDAMRARMGESGKHYIDKEFSWERVSEPFRALVAGLTDLSENEAEPGLSRR
jgi:glycosyltransferase involved in cell wall biosynthesis